MAHGPVCNMEAEDVEKHAMEMAEKGDQPHKEAMDKMHKESDGHDHGKM